MSNRARRNGGRASSGPDDEALVLLNERGDALHVAPIDVVESLRYMVARLRLRAGAELPDRLGLTSSISGEGVTYIARTLALVMANDTGRRVCLVDLNWWSPSAASVERAEAGLAEVLRGNVDLNDAIVASGTAGISILPAGAATAAERPLFAHSQDLDKVFVELAETYDQLILDLPAVHATSDALTLAERSRGVALVIAHGVTPESQIKEALDRLQGVELIGAILNRSSSRIPRAVRRRIPGA